MSYIEFQEVTRVYQTGQTTTIALDKAGFSVERGEMTIVVGPSGAGKTTLLNLLGGLDTVTQGHIFVNGRDITELSARQRTQYRRKDVGFVFQYYNLIQNLTARENVELAAELAGKSLDVEKVLQAVGLSDRMNNFPAQLSGGEQQRVAIARALAKDPELLLCDEPTGALDYETGKAVLALLRSQTGSAGKTVLLITHNSALTAMADRVIRMRNGKIQAIEVNEKPLPVQDISW